MKETKKAMNRKKIMVALVIALAFFAVFPAAREGFAEQAQSNEGFNMISDILTIFPQDQVEKAKAKGYDVKFAKYEPSRYRLEMTLENRQFWEVGDMVSDSGYTLLHMFNNMVWQFLLSWDFSVILIVENAFSLDVVNQFADAVEKTVQHMAGFTGNGYGHSGVIGNFLTFMIILAGAWIAYMGMIKKDTTKALNGMLSSLLILILSIAFFANAGGIMRYLNEISSGLSQEVMGVGLAFEKNLSPDTAPSYPADVSSMVIADKIYNMLVYEPYLMLQYGKTSADPKLTPERIHKILDYKVGSSAREQAVLEEKRGSPEQGIPPNPMVSTMGTFDRLMLIMLLCVAHFILGVLFFIIAGAMILYQFMFVLLALFAPFAFLLALHPAWSDIAVNWFKRFIGYQLVKLVIGVFFTLILTISQFLYQLTPPQKVGYVYTIVMQLILVVGVVWKRHELFHIMQAPMGEMKHFKGELNIEVPINYVTKYGQSLVERAAKLRVRR
jgi:hypothetical protein